MKELAGPTHAGAIEAQLETTTDATMKELFVPVRFKIGLMPAAEPVGRPIRAETHREVIILKEPIHELLIEAVLTKNQLYDVFPPIEKRRRPRKNNEKEFPVIEAVRDNEVMR